MASLLLIGLRLVDDPVGDLQGAGQLVGGDAELVGGVAGRGASDDLLGVVLALLPGVVVEAGRPGRPRPGP
jgi:hypothetical protein